MPRRTVKVYEAGKQDSGKRIVAETVVQAPVDVVSNLCNLPAPSSRCFHIVRLPVDQCSKVPQHACFAGVARAD